MNKLISIGRLEKQKNYRFLIDLFSESNIEIDVYGLGNEKKRLVEYSILKNTKINFLGRVENKILLSFLCSIVLDCFSERTLILNSIVESFYLSLFNTF